MKWGKDRAANCEQNENMEEFRDGVCSENLDSDVVAMKSAKDTA
jgi:hypothetical protein